MRAPPDRRTAYGPPPLVNAAALFGQECRKPDGSGARKRRDADDQGDGLSGGMTGDGSHRRRRQRPRPAGRKPYGRGEPTPGGRPRRPLGRLVGRRYVPTGTSFAPKAAVANGDCRAVRVQQWTAVADAPELYGARDMPNTRAHDRTRV